MNDEFKYRRSKMHRLEVGRDEAIRIGQKVYYDPSKCLKSYTHVWVRVEKDRDRCEECSIDRAKKYNTKRNFGITEDVQANAIAIRNADKKRDEMALSKFDDYDFDFDDE